ncbi:cell division protein FtsZ [Moraxella atlantae]|uniref:Cell division protein FtsZ n=1 Tax=Faucicola atlantae TaxID=34059 RepID=A0A378Q681_9GAMM|nr:cell division protein FtsZ [Moraxella atlantae]OPH37548.1 cell division protein FtsZ [Moraxella atlantae]STY96036.1 Cell division protein FtsZ [Moraxella atlantae]
MTLKFTGVSEQPVDDGMARLTVIGVGGGGGNAVEHMVQSGIKNINFVCINTDRQALDRMTAPNRLQLVADTNRGLGAGGNPEVGREAADSEEEHIRQLLATTDMVFITAGMGGGTGTGAAPVIARIAKEEGILTVAVVTTPFSFEGGRRMKVANEGIEQLTTYVDSIITIPNDKLMSVYGKISMRDAFKKADEVLLQAVQGIADMITFDGHMNIDFNDIKSAMATRGHAMMGTGRASGEDRAEAATEKAIKSPLLDNLLLKNAKGLVVNVISGGDFSLDEQARITEKVRSLVDIDDANIFYGFVFNDELGEELQVTVVATGLTIDNTPKNERRFVPDANSNSKVEAGTHEAAYRDAPSYPQSPSQPNSHTSQVAYAPQPATPAPQPSPAPAQPEPAPRTGNGMRIQDYLRRQQGK